MRPRLRRLVLCACFLIGIAGAPPASGQSGATRQVLVSIEFRAVRNGVPVFDLRPQEIALRVDGVDRELVALDLVRPHPGSSATPAPFATNVAPNRGRDLIFVIDEQSYQLGGESRLREAVSAALKQLTPRDRAGLVSLHASGPSVALTASPATVQAAVTQLRGRAIGPESAIDLSCRTRKLLPVLSSLFNGLDAGVTTTVILFSAAFAAPVTGVVSRGAESACLLLPNDFDEFRIAAAPSAAQLYTVHLADGTSAGQESRLGAGLERLAGETGGQFLRVAGDPAPMMSRMVSDASGFYVASFMSEPGSRASARRPVDLQVRRDGVTVRVRPQIDVPPLESKTVSPRDMMRAATGYRALPLRAAAFPSRGSDKTVKVVVLFEPVEPAVTLSSAMAGLFDAKGRLVAQWTPETEELARRPAMAGMTVAPGSYRLRVAAVDSHSRSGAVDADVRLEIEAAGPVTTSGVVLGAQYPTGFSPRLQFTNADPSAAVYLEVYGASSCSTVSAVLELAASDQSPALAKSVAQGSPVEQSDACVLFGEISITALPPADYALRVQLLRDGQVIGSRLSALRKSSR